MSVPDDMIRPWHAHIELGTGGTGKTNLIHFLQLCDVALSLYYHEDDLVVKLFNRFLRLFSFLLGRLYTAKTLYRKFEQIFPEMKLPSLVSNSYIHVSVSDLYTPRIGPSILRQQNRWTDRWKLGTRPRSFISWNT
jgi:hypothetical protein